MKCLKYKGYYIKKSDLSEEQINKIKKDLNWTPTVTLKSWLKNNS